MPLFSFCNTGNVSPHIKQNQTFCITTYHLTTQVSLIVHVPTDTSFNYFPFFVLAMLVFKPTWREQKRIQRNKLKFVSLYVVPLRGVIRGPSSLSFFIFLDDEIKC